MRGAFSEEVNCSRGVHLLRQQNLSENAPHVNGKSRLSTTQEYDDIKDKPRTGQINYLVKNMAETLGHLKSISGANRENRGILRRQVGTG